MNPVFRASEPARHVGMYRTGQRGATTAADLSLARRPSLARRAALPALVIAILRRGACGRRARDSPTRSVGRWPPIRAGLRPPCLRAALLRWVRRAAVARSDARP